MAGELVKVFGEVQIHARQHDSYVDATDLCRLTNKKWAHYRENKRTNDFLDALSAEVGIPTSALVESNRGGSQRGGTWIHPLVMVNFIVWASPKFEVQVTKWAFELMTTGKAELRPGAVEASPESLRKLTLLEGRLIHMQNQVDRLLAAPKQLEAGSGPRLEGPSWTVAAWLEENMPQWEPSSDQRHAIGQDAKRRVMRACPGERVGYFNRDLAFQAHQEYYLAKAAQHVYRKALRERKVETLGLFANEETAGVA